MHSRLQRKTWVGSQLCDFVEEESVRLNPLNIHSFLFQNFQWHFKKDKPPYFLDLWTWLFSEWLYSSFMQSFPYYALHLTYPFCLKCTDVVSISPNESNLLLRSEGANPSGIPPTYTTLLCAIALSCASRFSCVSLRRGDIDLASKMSNKMRERKLGNYDPGKP